MNRLWASRGSSASCTSTVASPAVHSPERWNSQASAPTVQALSHSTIHNAATASRRSDTSPSACANSPASWFSPASSTIRMT